MAISTLVKRAPRRASAIRSDTTIAIVASSHLATDILIGAFGAALPYLQGRFGLSGPQVAVLAAVLAVVLTPPDSAAYDLLHDKLTALMDWLRALG